MENKCHKNAAHGSGKCVARTEKAIRLGYSVCPACSPKNSAFAGNKAGIQYLQNARQVNFGIFRIRMVAVNQESD